MAGKRVRLTQRRRRKAVEDNTPYPGTANQPDRRFKPRAEYDNWEEVTNHPLPDMRHDWQSDERDDIGFGIPEAWGASPTSASVNVGAHKAVRLAILLLGEKTPEEVIEVQARDLMMLGPEIMDRTLERYASTAELYEASDKDKAEGSEDKDKAEGSDDDKEATEASEKKADDDPEPKKRLGEFDIELSATGSMDEDVDIDPKLAKKLGDALFGDDAEPDLSQVREASEKQGIAKLGGQPRVASSDGEVPISDIWQSAPDVSEVFN